MLRCFFLSFFLVVLASAQVPLGATKQQVIEKLGWPKSTSVAKDRELLYYTEYSIVLEKGRVTKLQFNPKGDKLPNTYTPPVPKVGPGPDRPPVTRPVRGQVPPPRVVNPNDANAHYQSVQTITARPPAVVPRATAPAPGVDPVKPDTYLQSVQTITAPRSAVVPPAAAPVRAKPIDLPVQPRTDIFAGAKWTVLLMVLLGGAMFALKLWGQAYARKQLKPDQFSNPARWSSPEPPMVEPPPIMPPKIKPRPDPLTVGWSLALLKEIEWHRFEHLVAAYEVEMGNDAELTSFGADGGIDVEVFALGSRSLKRIIQCKAFDNQRVGVELVRSFYGVMSLRQAPAGAFYTTSSFTDGALAISRDVAHLELVDGPTFLNRIQRLTLPAQLRLFDVATEGDYTTPTCPSCGVKMVLRTAGKGRNAGNSFWACAVPRCRTIINISRT